MIATTETRRAWLLLALAAAIVAMTFLAYLPVWRAGFVWDDDDYVTENQALRSAQGLRQVWVEPGVTHQFYPLVFTSFWAEYHLWGLKPLGFHLDNVLLHALNAVLLWLVLRRLGVPFAWLAAAIFALHPVNVESVAWVTERKNVLSGAFYLASLLSYFLFDPPEENAGRRPPFYFLAVALFVGALLSKTVTCTLPVAILIIFWWKRGRVRARDWAPLLPMFALGLTFGLVTAWMEKHSVGAAGAEWRLPLAGRVLVAGRALWFYLGKIVFPQELMFIYPRWKIDPGAAWQYLFPAGAAAAVGVLWWKRGRWGRGPLAATLFFAVTLSPALGFVDVFPFRYSFVADHFQYLASIGMICLAAGAIWSFREKSPAGYGAMAGLFLFCLGALTSLQAPAYNDEETLWRDTLSKNPDCLIAHYNLGNILARQGRREAIEQYGEAIRIDPRFYEAYSNRGSALMREGRTEEAIADFRRALAIQPAVAEVENNLGDALRHEARLDDAVSHFAAAARLAPDFALAHKNLGDTLVAEGKAGVAIPEYREVVRLLPDAAAARMELARALAMNREWRDGVLEYAKACRLAPNPQTVDGLAWLLATAGDPSARDGAKAVALAERCNAVTGNRQPAALETLAAAYAEAGRFAEAVEAEKRDLECQREAGTEPGRIAETQAHLALYQRGSAFHQP